ncbi:hypothetical protein RUM43_008980 [Polyplax serrata]|uniref:Uncharacterized protein n=1 Tax=Polyplax serrata TaxID=468196 RepID=A0AAN8PA38_POLSC
MYDRYIVREEIIQTDILAVLVYTWQEYRTAKQTTEIPEKVKTNVPASKILPDGLNEDIQKRGLVVNGHVDHKISIKCQSFMAGMDEEDVEEEEEEAEEAEGVE